MTPQFRKAVTKYGPRMMRDLTLDSIKVAGFFGNMAVESDQFRALQEYKPTIKGSKGGWGWVQWTGPRRRQFDAFAKSEGYALDDEEAFYQFLLHELQTTERGALAAVRKTTTVDEAAEVVMKRYERPGIPHLDKRKQYAREALEVLESVAGGSKSPKALLGSLKSLWPGSKNTDDGTVGTKGDPTVYRMQERLKALGYYKGILDGIPGRGTKAAVNEARQDNDMGEGTYDAEFLAALPTMPKAEVSEARRKLSRAEAKEHDPEAFKATGLMTKIGLGTLGTGTVSATGALDKAQEYAEKARGLHDQADSISDTVQLLSSPLLKPLLWVAQHPTLLLVVLGAILLTVGVLGARKIHKAIRRGHR